MTTWKRSSAGSARASRSARPTASSSTPTNRLRACSGWRRRATWSGHRWASTRRRFEIYDIAGRPLDPSTLPGERARERHEEAELLVRFRPSGGGEEHVALTRAVRILDEQGELRYVVSIFRKVTEEQAAETLRKLERVMKTALGHFSLANLVPSLLDEIEMYSGRTRPRSCCSTTRASG